MSGDPNQDYFVDGLAEEIITELSRFRWFFVVARNSSFAYKGRAVDVRLIGRQLGVRYVLEGGVRKSGDRLRITTQLIEAATANHLWAEKFDGQLADVFDLQDRITEGVVGAIEPSVRGAEIERASRKRPENLDAYDLYLRALAHPYYSKAENHQAVEFLLKAIKLDPHYANAYGLAACFASFGRRRVVGFRPLIRPSQTASKWPNLRRRKQGTSRKRCGWQGLYWHCSGAILRAVSR
jgi:adenylate cyclase